MRKNLLLLFLGLIILTAFYFTGCSSAVSIQNPVVGIVQIVGNEPFTKLAVNINDKDVYLLDCTKEMQAELIKNQNRVYEIIYSDVKKTDEGIILVVKQAIPIKTK